MVDGGPPSVPWLVDGREVGKAAFPCQSRWTLGPGEHELVAEAEGVQSEPVRVTVRP